MVQVKFAPLELRQDPLLPDPYGEDHHSPMK